jgi:pimeloyl-ACP methyl ester carboxylesterase
VSTLALSDGRRLCLRRWASPGAGGDPIVVLHGLLDSSEGWGPLAERLRREQIAFDLPGFGYSDVPRRGSFAGYAGDIAEAVDASASRASRCSDTRSEAGWPPRWPS